MQSINAFNYNRRIVDKSNGLIPVMYEYDSCYKKSSKKLNLIPLPVNLKSISCDPNNIKDKIVVFHGLSRYGFKGTRHVENAFKVLKEKYLMI